MNAARDSLVENAEALSRALADGDEVGVQRCLVVLTQSAEGSLCNTLASVVQRLHQDLDALPRGTALAHAELPDASERLDHVVRLTETAAHQTLDCIEDGQKAAEQLSHHDDPAVRQLAQGLRERLRDAAAAQAYQDLTGQLLRQVIKVLANLRGSLDRIVDDAGVVAIAPETGPLLPGANNAASQGDADQMLADLGL